jgi:hypothetical protein
MTQVLAPSIEQIEQNVEQVPAYKGSKRRMAVAVLAAVVVGTLAWLGAFSSEGQQIYNGRAIPARWGVMAESSLTDQPIYSRPGSGDDESARVAWWARRALLGATADSSAEVQPIYNRQARPARWAD